MNFNIVLDIKMNYVTDDIARSLKQARLNKGLSQRELSAVSGLPQSHISNIESGAVDLRLSSLLSLARILGLEIELVPKRFVPVVNKILQSDNMDELSTKPLYRLDDQADE